MSAEQAARQTIDKLLTQAGLAVQDFKQADIHAARGVAIGEFVLNEGYGFADYLLYVDGKAAGVIEAKKQGATLTGVEIQSARYAKGLPGTLPRQATRGHCARTTAWFHYHDSDCVGSSDPSAGRSRVRSEVTVTIAPAARSEPYSRMTSSQTEP